MPSKFLHLLLCSATAFAQPTMHEVAKVAERPAGAPTYADVCFRYMGVRKSKFPTVEDAKQAIRNFHATRIDWFYPGHHYSETGSQIRPEAKAFIDWCHSRDMKVGGAINNNTRNPEWKYKKHHLDRFVGEVKNAEFCKKVVAWGVAQIDAGVDTIVCDDIFKYDKERQDLWSREVLTKIKAHKPGFTIAGNSGHNISTEYVKRFVVDFHYSDNNFVPTPSEWWEASKAHRAEKSAILLHPNRPRTINIHRAMIAFGYANGAHVIAPWDEYIHGKDRLFADPADFADLYGFARALGEADYLNGYEDAAVGGFDLKEDRYGKLTPIAIKGGSGKLSIFTRAIPGDPKAPLVIHLIDSEAGKPATLMLNKSAARQLASGNLRYQLLTPPTYDKAAHAKASSTKNYSTLLRSTSIKPIAEGDVLNFNIPALQPWAVFVITPEG